MMKTYKFRLYPNQEQDNILQECLNTCRFIYNTALEDRINLTVQEDPFLALAGRG